MTWIVEMAKEDARNATGSACPKARFSLSDSNFEVYIEAFEKALDDKALRGR
jgi:hypothetical protein